MIAANNIKLVIGGQERTFYFGLGALGLFVENTGKELGDIQTHLKSNPFKLIPELMYWGLRYGYEREGKKFEYSMFDMADWIDEAGGMNGEVCGIYLQALIKSMTGDIPKEKESPNPSSRAKKK